MPTVDHYDPTARLIYHRYSGNLTGQEFYESFAGEKDFFADMTGLVGMLVDLSDIKAVPPNALNIGRNTVFARYRPLLIVVVGGHTFARTIAQTFARITGHTMEFFEDFATADAYMRDKVAQWHSEQINNTES